MCIGPKLSMLICMENPVHNLPMKHVNRKNLRILCSMQVCNAFHLLQLVFPDVLCKYSSALSPAHSRQDSRCLSVIFMPLSSIMELVILFRVLDSADFFFAFHCNFLRLEVWIMYKKFIKKKKKKKRKQQYVLCTSVWN